HLVPILIGAGLISTETNECVCVVIDISERKVIENQLREAQQFLQLVLDTFPLSVFWKDRHSVYLGCNQNFAHHANLPSPTAIIGKTDYELPWKDNEAHLFRADDRQVIDSSIPKLHIEETLSLGQGKQKWIETNKIPLRDLSGQVIGVLGTFQDITQRKQAEIELKNLSERLTLALQAGAIGSWEWHLGATTYWDKENLKLYGLPTDNSIVLFEQWIKYVHPEDREFVKNGVEKIVQIEPTFNFEFRIIRADGELRWIQAFGIVQRDRTGQAIRIVGINRDITEQKNYENNLKKT
ncbi:MAG: PAS domain-containing protein, partial [Microcystaceae cyanobacterium]